MKKKSLKRMFPSIFAVALSISMLPLAAAAATLVIPESAQDSPEPIPVEYFSSTLIDYDQIKTNQATAAADIIPNGIWEDKQDGNVYFYDLTNQNGEYQKTAYHIRLLADGQYYPAIVSRTQDGDNYIYKLYYQAADGSYVWIDTWRGDEPDNNYPVDKPGNGEDDYGKGDNNAPNSGKLVYNENDNKRVQLFQQGGTQEGKGFYFTTDKGGKPEEQYIPLYSKIWGQNKTDGPVIPGGQVNGENDPNNAGQDQDFYIYSGLAADKLSESTNAPFDTEDDGNGDEIVNAAPGFLSTDPTVGTDYRTVYTNVGVPYVYDEETGNYTLDSDKNGVYFDNGNAASDTNMKIADLPSAIKMNGDGKLVTGLAPFVDVTGTVVDAAPSGRDSVGGTSNETVKAYQMNFANNNAIAAEQLFAFGMVTEVKFQMTDDGKSPINGEDIKFHFSGDDDVWVYIDGVLALDIGGVHDAVKGEIDFATGEVTVSAPNCRIGKVGDRAANPTMDNRKAVAELAQGNIYAKLGTTLTGFAAQGEHTLKIYYLDRGEGKTNCLIQFNLPQRDTIEVTKKFDSAKNDAGEISAIDSDELANYGGREFGFTLYEDDNAVANKTYYVYDSSNDLIRTASTNAAGHFTLKRNETARFLVDIGENNTFYVVEDVMTVDKDGFLTPNWTYTTNVAGAAATDVAVNAFKGMTVTATGSDTVADKITFVCENYLSANVPNPGVRTQDDRIVLDYGLPITITADDILKNDIIRGEKITLSLKDSENTSYGTAAFSDNNTPDDVTDDTITYILDKQLTGIETLTYSVTVTGTGNEETEITTEETTADGNILIMPATSMYYEENFGGAGTEETIGGNPYVQYAMVSYSNGVTKWESVEEEPLSGNQETGIVGTVGDSTYGSDTVYLSNLGDSYGTSMMASAVAKAALFEYDFIGTGTAIYGRVSHDTGYIRVKITHTEGDDTVVTVTDDLQYIDTASIVSVGGSPILYNIPIYLNESLDGDYNKYHVEVMLYAKGTPTVHGDSGAEFYLDGIRVYNPVVDNDIVSTAYADDGEANTVIINIRDKVVGDSEDGFLNDEFFTLTDVNGEIIKNGDGTTTTPGGDTDTVEDYNVYGPNNEFYLNNVGTDNKVYIVSFKLLNWDSTRYKLYLGMKTPSGSAANVTVGGTLIDLKNSADCCYDISNYVQVTSETVDGGPLNIGTVTIKGNTGLVSLTNIKVTGVDEFTLGDAKDYEDSNGDDKNGGTESVSRARTLYMVPADYSLNSKINDETVVPGDGEVDGEETEEVLFTPEYFNAGCSYVKSLKRATISVTASKDVSYVTVNGERVNGIKLWNGNIFLYFGGFAQKDTDFKVIAYNADGAASETYIVTAE